MLVRFSFAEPSGSRLHCTPLEMTILRGELKITPKADNALKGKLPINTLASIDDLELRVY